MHTINKEKEYPYVLLATADHDDRVVPSHSYKYISELQFQNGHQERPFLIRIDTKAGHGAGKPTAKIVSVSSPCRWPTLSLLLRRIFCCFFVHHEDRRTCGQILIHCSRHELGMASLVNHRTAISYLSTYNAHDMKIKDDY